MGFSAEWICTCAKEGKTCKACIRVERESIRWRMMMDKNRYVDDRELEAELRCKAGVEEK